MSAHLLPAELIGTSRVEDITRALVESSNVDELRSWMRGTPLGVRISHAESARASGTRAQRRAAYANLGQSLVEQSAHLEALLDDHARPTFAVLRPLVRGNRHVSTGVREAIAQGGMAPRTIELLERLDIDLRLR